jgi:hypothetical protein
MQWCTIEHVQALELELETTRAASRVLELERKVQVWSSWYPPSKNIWCSLNAIQAAIPDT